MTSHIIKQAENCHRQHASCCLWRGRQETNFFSFFSVSCNWSSFHPQLIEQLTKPQTKKPRLAQCKASACCGQIWVHCVDSKTHEGGSVKYLVLHVFAPSLSNQTSDHTVWSCVPVKRGGGCFFVGVIIVEASRSDYLQHFKRRNTFTTVLSITYCTGPLVTTVSNRAVCNSKFLV